MLSLIRRLFRRCPPHLVGRVPVDAGVGVAVGDGVPKSIVEAIKVHGGFMEAYREHHTKRQYEQAPALASGARPDWAMRAAQQAPPPRTATQEHMAFLHAEAKRQGHERILVREDIPNDGYAIHALKGDELVLLATVSRRQMLSTHESEWQTKFLISSGLACPRPSPIINAQRYSKPDWTW